MSDQAAERVAKAIKLAEESALSGHDLAAAECLRAVGLTTVATLVERGYWDHRALVRIAETCARRVDA